MSCREIEKNHYTIPGTGIWGDRALQGSIETAIEQCSNGTYGAVVKDFSSMWKALNTIFFYGAEVTSHRTYEEAAQKLKGYVEGRGGR